MKQNPTDASKGLNAGGSIINVASFVGMLGAATPQIACLFHVSLANLPSCGREQIRHPRYSA
jgi:hypothetical protein